MVPYLECGNGKVFEFTNKYQNYHFGYGVQYFPRISLLLMSYMIVQQRRMNIKVKVLSSPDVTQFVMFV